MVPSSVPPTARPEAWTISATAILAFASSLPRSLFETGNEAYSGWKKRIGQLGGWVDSLAGWKEGRQDGWKCLGN